MEEFYPFFLIIFAGVFFSMIFRRMHVPWVVGLIAGGIMIGPRVFNILTITPTTEFIGQIGLVFLMFMAGLETKFSSFREFRWRLFMVAGVIGIIPFLVGMGIAFLFGYGWVSILLVGIIFISSSIAVIIPTLERQQLLHTRLGQSIVVTVIIQDIVSLVLLSIVLQNVSPVTELPLFLFYPLVVGVLFLFRFLLPKLELLFTRSVNNTQDEFQQEFRITFLMLLGTVIAFELLGLHPIIASFFTGLILSETIASTALKEKIRTISYGIFIPTFFIIIGAQTDITLLFNASGAIVLVISIIAGLIGSKIISGWIGAKLAGFTFLQSLFFGASLVPQLSTTLAVAFTSFSFGFIDQQLIIAMVVLSIVSVMIGPILMNLLSKSLH
jgi:Kef-type K+ transport system membrane component KefB